MLKQVNLDKQSVNFWKRAVLWDARAGKLEENLYFELKPVLLHVRILHSRFGGCSMLKYSLSRARTLFRSGEEEGDYNTIETTLEKIIRGGILPTTVPLWQRSLYNISQFLLWYGSFKSYGPVKIVICVHCMVNLENQGLKMGRKNWNWPPHPFPLELFHRLRRVVLSTWLNWDWFLMILHELLNILRKSIRIGWGEKYLLLLFMHHFRLFNNSLCDRVYLSRLLKKIARTFFLACCQEQCCIYYLS